MTGEQQVKTAAKLRTLYAARIATEQRIHEQLQQRIQNMWRYGSGSGSGRGFSYLQVVVHQWMWDVARRDKAKLPPPSLGWRWS